MSASPSSRPSRKIPWKRITIIVAAIITATGGIIAAAISNNEGFHPLSPTATSSPTSVITTPLSPEQAQKRYLDIIDTQTPTLTDSLTVQDFNVWDERTSKDASNGCAFEGGGYHAFMSQPNIVECLAKGVVLSNNFVYQVRINIQQGDGGGIIFGSPASNDKMKYRFYINTGSYCDVFNPFKKGPPLYSNSHAPISSNSTLVAVMVISDTIYLFINKKYVAFIYTIDNGPLSGQIGVFGEEVNKSTDVFFDQLSVWQMAG